MARQGERVPYRLSLSLSLSRALCVSGREFAQESQSRVLAFEPQEGGRKVQVAEKTPLSFLSGKLSGGG